MSPDEKYLYVSSNHPDEPFIYKASLNALNEGFSVFTPTKCRWNIKRQAGESINKFNPDEKLCDSIFMDEPISNLTWGAPL